MRIAIDYATLEIIKGDITEQRTDAIVNAANNHLWMGGGVAGAIKRKGGEIIEEEAVALGPVEVGQAVLTTGGELAVRHIIHAAVMGQDLHTNAGAIATATRAALSLAGKEKMTSLSFPALGTGVGGFSPFHCARIMIGETIAYLCGAGAKEKNLRKVIFVLFDQEVFAAFEEELKMQFSAKRH